MNNPRCCSASTISPVETHVWGEIKIEVFPMHQISNSVFFLYFCVMPLGYSNTVKHIMSFLSTFFIFRIYKTPNYSLKKDCYSLIIIQSLEIKHFRTLSHIPWCCFRWRPLECFNFCSPRLQSPQFPLKLTLRPCRRMFFNDYLKNHANKSKFTYQKAPKSSSS